MFLDLLLQSGNVATALSAIFVLLFACWKYIFRPIIQNLAARWGEFLAKVDTVPEILEQVDKLTEQICADDTKDQSIGEKIFSVQNRLAIAEQIQDYMLLDAGIATFMSNEKGEFTHVNREFAAMMRKTTEELLGNGWITLLETNVEIRSSIIESWEQAWKKEYDLVLPYVRFIQHDGSFLPVRIVAYKVLDNYGKFIGHIGFIKKLELRRSTDINVSTIQEYSEHRSESAKDSNKFKRDK